MFVYLVDSRCRLYIVGVFPTFSVAPSGHRSTTYIHFYLQWLLQTYRDQLTARLGLVTMDIYSFGGIGNSLEQRQVRIIRLIHRRKYLRSASR